MLGVGALRELETRDERDRGEAQRRRRRSSRSPSSSGNTPAVCRKCYVHPAVIEAYLEASPSQPFAEALGRKLTVVAEADTALDPDESAVLRLLRRRLEASASA